MQPQSRTSPIYRLFALLALVMLSGCTPWIKPPTAAVPALSWKARQHQLLAQNTWDVSGNIGIRTANTGESASFHWQQRNNAYIIEFYGPLGIGHAQLVGSPQSITLQTTDLKTYTAKNPEALLRSRLGWQIPVTQLIYWVRGVPAPRLAASTRLDNAHRLNQLEQQGWRIEYQDYTNVNDMDLPSKITLDRPNLHIRIVIREWRV